MLETHEKKSRQFPADKSIVPPHSISAEQSVLGGLMLDAQAWEKVSVILTDNDFYRSDHRLIYQAIAELVRLERPVDVLTVSERLHETKHLEQIGGEIYLFELARNIPSAGNIVAYANIVRDRAILRQLISAAQQMTQRAFHTEGNEVREILNQAEQMVFAIAEQDKRGTGPQKIQDLLVVAMERISELFHSTSPITGEATGFTDFDMMTSGLQPADLIVVAGRPSMGKTTLAVNMAEHIAIKQKKPVLIFSMEMSASSLAMRLLSSLCRIDQHKMRSGKLSDDDWPRLTSTMSMLAEVPLLIDDTPGLSPQELQARARRVVREHGSLGLIVIDYLQLMKIPGFSENRTGEISEISRSLKLMAKELNVPVIAASQLNRSLEQRSDRRPIMSDLRESGAIEQDADLIAFIYRDEVYNENSPDKGIAEIIIAKQRNGPVGKVKLAFLGKYTRFENLANQR